MGHADPRFPGLPAISSNFFSGGRARAARMEREGAGTDHVCSAHTPEDRKVLLVAQAATCGCYALLSTDRAVKERASARYDPHE